MREITWLILITMKGILEIIKVHIILVEFRICYSAQREFAATVELSDLLGRHSGRGQIGKTESNGAHKRSSQTEFTNRG